MPEFDFRALILVFAIVLDWLIGDPKKLYSIVAHPVVFMGEMLSLIEGWLNKPGRSFAQQKRRGVFALLLFLGVWVLSGAALTILFDLAGVWGLLLEGVVVAIFLGGRSLYNHVLDVCNALKFKTLEEGRLAVGHIVGRDTAALDEYGVARAAIESGAENLSDGFIGPLLFYLIGGLPGIFLYKATNTADSMIGHKTARFIGFGWAAARFDDLLNYIPARLTGAMIAFMAHFLCGRGRESWFVMRRDGGKHSSPNAGWPEAAMAGALGVALAGPRVYRDMMKQDPWINAKGRLNAGAEEIWHALRLIEGVIYLTLPLVGAFGVLIFL